MSSEEQQLDCNEIIPRLFLGSEDAAYADLNILTQVEPYKFTHICAVDLPVYNIVQDAISCAEFIEKALSDGENNRVLVHCSRGVSRSASIITAYLMLKRGMTFEEAYYGNVKKKRPIACLNQGFLEQVKSLEKKN